ncbi:MAG: Glycosyl transferase family 2 [Candidatus Nomurabacteria bacterium GW2011_GWA2_40_9]|uniref:Glycosyl transferase family 2 n=1 Tax=Candidatus Nomurabacteria bacterium GW2011_GWA2_40_9 TaxID=1618734 RepID=A0A0G0TP51_9BACT|nr:MAG: Glycosyl transferase family 2 [Candidatus Nomurabacteria bacterium GW2011_GWA2_40_9]
MRVVITIPAYNEERTIGKVISNIKEVMKKTKYSYRILVVDDGSKDKTAEISKKSGAVVYKHPKKYGLAETFKTEMQKCLELNADVIVHIDADGQYLAREIPLLIREIEKGNELVLGSRFKGKIESMPLIKRLGNIAFSKVISQITKVKITDAQTGFRAFTKEVAKKINIISNYTYTQEQIIRAARKKFKIKEVPVYFASRKSGKSRLISNPFRYAANAWINIFRIYRDYEPLKFFGAIGGFFFSIGALIGLWFVYLHFTSGIRGHPGLITLMFLLLIMGIQIAIFGFLADMSKK